MSNDGSAEGMISSLPLGRSAIRDAHGANGSDGGLRSALHSS